MRDADVVPAPKLADIALEVGWMTERQQWAIDVAVDAGLELRLGGAVFLRGDVGPFQPYLPAAHICDEVRCPSVGLSGSSDVASEPGGDRTMAKQPRSLYGKVAVVTGGGRGIGKALALALTSAGCRVAIGDVDGPAAALAADGDRRRRHRAARST